MRVSSQFTDEKHSTKDLVDAVTTFSNSGAGVIHVRTSEVWRAVAALREAALLEGYTYQQWDVVNGLRLFDVTTLSEDPPPDPLSTNFMDALAKPAHDLASGQYLANNGFSYYVYVNPQYWMANNPISEYHVQRYVALLEPTDIRIVLITDDKPLPESLQESVAVTRFAVPSHADLLESLDNILGGVEGESEDNAESLVDLSKDDKEKVCFAAAGLPMASFEMYASLAIVEAGSVNDTVGVDHMLTGISKGKTEIVNKNDILELYPTTDMSQVGGMDNLKEWVRKRKNCFSQEAKDFGIEAPKGLLCVGPAGTGKTHMAKAIASELGVPLIKFDIGKVYSSLVGSSEERCRTALRMLEDMSPCVAIMDEVEKALGGAGSGGDSGTSMRVLGTILSWMQDNTSPVYIIATANNIQGLPPELLRKGRFDAIFSVGFPSDSERMDILDIHLNKRGWDAEKFKDSDKRMVITASKHYTPAEIEQAVKDGLIDAFSLEESFTMAHVVDALQGMIPMSTMNAEAVEAMNAWCKNNATPASSPDEKVASKVTSIRRRRSRIRKPTKDD